MGLITKTKVTTPSFAEQLGKIKEQFKVAHENASNLHSQKWNRRLRKRLK